jgi:hypothetical protein
METPANWTRRSVIERDEQIDRAALAGGGAAAIPKR